MVPVAPVAANASRACELATSPMACTAQDSPPPVARVRSGASVQPEHAIDDRDLTDAIWAQQTAVPYPLRALADAGANLLFGSDAPVSGHERRPGKRPEFGGCGERRAGIQPLLGPPRGATVPRAVHGRATRVAATLLAGRLTHVA
jgi:hypothetical protein